MASYLWLGRYVFIFLSFFVLAIQASAQNGPELINQNSSFEEGFTGWDNYIDAAAGASFDVSKDAIEGNKCAHITIIKISGTNWHVGLSQDKLDLKGGQLHTMDFYARADIKRTISFEIKRSPGLGAWEGVTELDMIITKDWDEYVHNFTPGKDYKQAALLAFWVGQEKGEVWIDGVRLYEGKKQDRPNLALPKSVMSGDKLVTVWARIKTK